MNESSAQSADKVLPEELKNLIADGKKGLVIGNPSDPENTFVLGIIYAYKKLRAQSKAQSGGEEISGQFLQPFEKFKELTVFIQQMASSGMVPHGSGWTSFLYELNEVCKLASSHPPVVEGGLRWVKASERLPDKWQKDRHTKVLIIGKHLNVKIDRRPASGYFFQIGNYIKFDYKGGHDGDGYNGSILEDEFDRIQWLEEIPTRVTEPEITAENLLRGSRSLTRQEADILDQTMQRMAKKEDSPTEGDTITHKY
jgi:hypothetical protein